MWGRSGIIHTSTTNCFSIDYLPSALDRHGWLAVGTTKNIGVVWVNKGNSEHEPRLQKTQPCFTGEANYCCSNFNLRDQAGEVHVVRWDPLGQRMVTFNTWGALVLWRNRAGVLAFEYEISNLPKITDIQWSNCGSFLFTCAEDGHIQLLTALDGSCIFLQQIFSTSIWSPRTSFSCCSWNHDNSAVAVGTTHGEIVEVSITDPGVMLQTTETKSARVNSLDYYRHRLEIGYTAYLTSGQVVLMTKSDGARSLSCNYTDTSLMDGDAKWNHSRGLLAVVGIDSLVKVLKAKVIGTSGRCLMTLALTLEPVHKCPLLKKPISVVWDDCHGFYVSHQTSLHYVHMNGDFPTLKHLCEETVNSVVRNEDKRASLPLPPSMCSRLKTNANLIMGIQLPLSLQPLGNWEPLFLPIPHNQRLHCSIDLIHNSSASQQQYILYLEHAGTALPFLQANVTTSKISPFNAHITIKPTSSLLFLANNELWAQCLTTDANKTASGERHFYLPFCKKTFARLKKMIGRRTQVRAVSNPPMGLGSPGSSPSRCRSWARLYENLSGPPILASTNFNTLSLKSSFTGLLSKDRDLGALSISPNYFRNEPRHIMVNLPPVPGNHDGILLQSKRPHWNPQSAVYELDFGGRIDRDSVKNFQLEHNGAVVLQFGRVQEGYFCLDFDRPLSPVQAFCIGMSCIV